VAKETILVCDLCKTQQPAIGTFDLCATHAKGARKPKPKPQHAWNKADYDTVQAKIMELANSVPFFTGADVQRVAGIKSSVANVAVKNLIKAGQIEATGKSAGRKLSKAS
jgi:hypothetical protein